MKESEELKEQYLVSIADASRNEILYTLVPSNREFACLLDTINPNIHVIMSVSPIANVIDFKELMSRLIKSNKPKGLNFGEEENGNR